MKNLKVNMMK